jgi:hypothetical protein
LASCILGHQSLAGDGDALLDERANFFGFGDGRDDAAFHLWLVFVVLGVALGKEKRGGQGSLECALMLGGTA